MAKKENPGEHTPVEREAERFYDEIIKNEEKLQSSESYRESLKHPVRHALRNAVRNLGFGNLVKDRAEKIVETATHARDYAWEGDENGARNALGNAYQILANMRIDRMKDYEDAIKSNEKDLQSTEEYIERLRNILSKPSLGPTSRAVDKSIQEDIARNEELASKYSRNISEYTNLMVDAQGESTNYFKRALGHYQDIDNKANFSRAVKSYDKQMDTVLKKINPSQGRESGASGRRKGIESTVEVVALVAFLASVPFLANSITGNVSLVDSLTNLNKTTGIGLTLFFIGLVLAITSIIFSFRRNKK